MKHQTEPRPIAGHFLQVAIYFAMVVIETNLIPHLGRELVCGPLIQNNFVVRQRFIIRGTEAGDHRIVNALLRRDILNGVNEIG